MSKKSNPIKLKVNSGSTKVLFIQPVKIAPTDSRKHSSPKIILKTINGELSMRLKRNSLSIANKI